jgi:hypothetical protein
MPAIPKKHFAGWRLALLLSVVGGVCGYLSFIGAAKNMWGGGDSSADEGFFLLACLVSVAAFLSGMVCFFAIALKAVASNSGPTLGGPVMQSPAAASYPALILFRVTTASVIALATLDMLQRGWPSLSSRYGQFHLFSAIVTLLLSQLPFAVALLRTWRTDDHAGLALAIAAGTLQAIDSLPFFRFFLNLPATFWTPGAMLHVLLGGVVVVLASLAWRTSGWSEGDVGLLISILFGFLFYTVLWNVAFEILSARAFH